MSRTASESAAPTVEVVIDPLAILHEAEEVIRELDRLAEAEAAMTELPSLWDDE